MSNLIVDVHGIVCVEDCEILNNDYVCAPFLWCSIQVLFISFPSLSLPPLCPSSLSLCPPSVPPLSLCPPLSLPLQSLLQTYDRDILQELWKIRTGIHEIREGHKQAEESKEQDDTSSERSLSPSSLKKPGEDQHSLSPSPNSDTGTCNVLSRCHHDLPIVNVG